MGGTSRQRLFQRLRPLAVARNKKPGYHADGGGLNLQISPAGTRSWIFRFTLNGRAREMGLGSINTVSLPLAREKAADCRRLLLDGIDPIETRDTKRLQERLERARSMTFADCAKAYIDAHRSSWKNAKHVAQWENTLATYTYPVFGPLPVQAVDTALVTKALQPIWTLDRLRARPLGQELVQVSAPPGGIVTRAQLASRRRIEHQFDTAT